jgi:acetolactate synthase-1/2/3 large subunit
VHPDRNVVAFVGDASLEMVLGELATLRDLALPLTVVVFVDASLALIDLKQRNMGYATAGVDFGASDFPAVARAFDIHGVWADDREVLAKELSDAQAALRRAFLRQNAEATPPPRADFP